MDEAIRHERVVWPSIEHKTVYHGPPTDETDQVWDNLYVPCKQHLSPRLACIVDLIIILPFVTDGISMIKGWQNKKLWKQTAPEPLAVDGYKVSIDVTHYIHCLVRRLLIRIVLPLTSYSSLLRTSFVSLLGPNDTVELLRIDLLSLERLLSTTSTTGEYLIVSSPI